MTKERLRHARVLPYRRAFPVDTWFAKARSTAGSSAGGLGIVSSQQLLSPPRAQELKSPPHIIISALTSARHPLTFTLYRSYKHSALCLCLSPYLLHLIDLASLRYQVRTSSSRSATSTSSSLLPQLATTSQAQQQKRPHVKSSVRIFSRIGPLRVLSSSRPLTCDEASAGFSIQSVQHFCFALAFPRSGQ